MPGPNLIRLPQLTGPIGVPPGVQGMLTQPLQPKSGAHAYPSDVSYGVDRPGEEWWWNRPVAQREGAQSVRAVQQVDCPCLCSVPVCVWGGAG